jgi:hypothetical protein
MYPSVDSEIKGGKHDRRSICQNFFLNSNPYFPFNRHDRSSRVASKNAYFLFLHCYHYFLNYYSKIEEEQLEYKNFHESSFQYKIMN